MASEIDSLKTNEFLRRRKLRLQQVREQSKEIAKKIRQRAKVEKLRHLTTVDAQKEKEYFECQEKLVKRLELLYAKSLDNVGASHKSACEISKQDIVEKKDLSKLRGKEAVAELRKRRQAQLDEQKKILDRKLQAREIANEISREKSSMIVKNLTKQTKRNEDSLSKSLINSDEVNKDKDSQNKDCEKDNSEKLKSDMATQWDCNELLNEWEPNVPELVLPKEDSIKGSTNENDKSDKSKNMNLFALSADMPSSLRGGLTSVPENIVHMKPSLSLVSEYLQNRNLKLRQTETNKKPTEDLQSIKQTILRTRSSRADGRVYDNVCEVLDEQIIPVPSWQLENNISKTNQSHELYMLKSKEAACSPKIHYNNLHEYNFFKDPIQCKKKLCHKIIDTGKEKSSRSVEPEISLGRKKSVSVYNHNTRDLLDMPCDKEKFVCRDNKTDEDAYAQALKVTNSINTMDSEQLNKKQEHLRNKVAVTRQTIDKEYRDTLAFLNSLPKNTDARPIRGAYMNDDQQQLSKDRHQRKLQQEFKEIQKECLKHNCKHGKRKPTILEKSRSKSKSPVNLVNDSREVFEYSWMPVPESDGNLAIHTIPVNRKQGNSVKFSGTDSYHEYRSRHKHTPPTKEVNDDRPSKRIVERVILQNDSENESTTYSETSSIENLNLDKNDSKVNTHIQDAERIIIYKILNSRRDKRKRKPEVAAQSVNLKNTVADTQDGEKVLTNSDKTIGDDPKGVSVERMHEGVYKAVSKDGDNITSMYFPEEPSHNQRSDFNTGLQNGDNKSDICSCGKNLSKTHQDKDIEKEGGDTASRINLNNCNCVNVGIESDNLPKTSAATSMASFKTAPNKTNDANTEGFIKLLDEGGSETGKFYIGASGFIKDDNYEVVIQLRKKEAEKSNKVVQGVLPVETCTTVCENKIIVESTCTEKESEECMVPPSVTVDKETTTENSHTEEASRKNKENVNQSHSNTNNMCEKAVLTSFQEIPIETTKTEPILRPATSAYTQTSFNSSVPRPVFMHMSSSTSTAYMSPPDLVLPKFLRNDYVLSHEEMYESENTINQLESQDEIIHDTRRSRKHKHCRSNHCNCSAKEVHNKNYQKRHNIETPPNTARQSGDLKEIEKRKCKCHKCKSRSDTKICCKSHRKRSNSSMHTKSSREFINVKSPQTSKHKQIPLKNLQKSKNTEAKMNPMLKTYVHKLLALNKEGLKAVEIINQDCSIPTTPGSSIINLPSNKNSKSGQLYLENKISLEQIKDILKSQIMQENPDLRQGSKKNLQNTEIQTEKVRLATAKLPKKKSLHKVKSLNISRQFQKRKKCDAYRPARMSKVTTSSSAREEKNVYSVDRNARSRSKSCVTPRLYENSEYKNSTSSDITERISLKSKNVNTRNVPDKNNFYTSENSNSNGPTKCSHLPTRTMMTSMSSDSEIPSSMINHLNIQQIPANISTQTNDLINTEINFMKLAEDKLHNMEKIADLTDKCTKRLSNLAKVLEEVRRNKSLVYSQMSTSDTASDLDTKSENNEKITHNTNLPVAQDKEILQTNTSLALPLPSDEKIVHNKVSLEFTPFLKDIPKPDTFKTPSKVAPILNELTTAKSISNTDGIGTNARGRPPPALTRHLKNGQEMVMPHELSTVIEVDSPMSIKLKSQSSRQDIGLDTADKTNKLIEEVDNVPSQTVMVDHTATNEKEVNPDLLENNVEKVLRFASSSNDSSDDSKRRMMDMKHFNKIMLKPFISLQDYAKQNNIGIDEGSNLDDVVKDDVVNDDISSLHSDGSLPDVIAELLKRNIISEPFKFDTASNVNSTLSSESTLSLIALSKAKRDKKKSGLSLKNKENVEETSDSLSVSSNPDLENAFKKLGLGWASSTLKKTKERLALSSSSNTSSCSLTQFKIRTFSQDLPVFASDSTSSLADVSNKREKKKSYTNHANENSRNAVQQTSLTNSMTVNEFLTNVLANKITFSNKSNNNNDIDRSQPEFISLYETKIPEDMRLSKLKVEEDKSSTSSANNNRARTSTPVQIFKSTAYQSSTSSNTSNGLFSNADDLSSVKVTSTSIRNHSTSDKDELTIPNYSLKTKKGFSDRSKSD